MSSKANQFFKSWGLLILLSCIWGSSFILMKKGMFTADEKPIFSAVQVGALRMLIASTVLLPIAVRALYQLKNKRNLVFFAVVGVCGNFIPAFLFTYAETGISSGLAGMLNSLTPIFTLLVGLLFFRQKLTVLQVVGSIIGTLGITALVYTGKNSTQSGDLLPVFAIVLATFLYGVSLNTIKNKLQEYPSMHISAIALSLIFVPALIVFFLSKTPQTIQQNPHAWEGLAAISILAVIGTAIAVIIYNSMIRASSTLFASSVTYFIPFVAIGIGTYYGEEITLGQVGSMVIVLAGVVLANYGQKIFGRKE